MPLLALRAAALLGIATAGRRLWKRSATVRGRGFERMSEEPLVVIPGEGTTADDFTALYRHPATRRRRKGASLSNLHFYWLSPSAAIHQENLEDGPAYERVAATTRRILAVPPAEARHLAGRLAAEALERPVADRPTVLRVRDLMTPVWADFFYELVFHEPCPTATRALIVANSDNLLGTIKHITPLDLRVRDRLISALTHRLATGPAVPALPESLTLRQQALYLQGVVFGTGVAQMSEAVAHLCMNLATRPPLQHAIARDADSGLLHAAIQESLRLFPLFGIAHRVTTADIETARLRIPAGSVLCFDYTAYHREGQDRPDEFLPERWQHPSAAPTHHAPFGVTGNRPCPARGLAPGLIDAATREILQRYTLHTAARHTRPLHNRGPCLFTPKQAASSPHRIRARLLLARIHLGDHLEEVYYRAAQLIVGTRTTRRARRAGLCDRAFGE
ncbi:cytochrome P450 [Streptomyces sp. NPDC094032]|uniref:cytochrome P450 n=1 Tax=Streptomyces sp. NPDC094032 TaxID=3155308 RepID=UPI0033319266